MPRPRQDVGVRIQALVYLNQGMPVNEISRLLKTSRASIYRWRSIATERGFDPNKNKGIQLEYLVDAPRSGRPPKVTKQIERQIVKAITKTKTSRSLTGLEIGLQVGLSERTIHRVLKRLGYRKVKPTVKPGLTEEMRKARLKFAIEHKDWTLEDWKNIIWSDETSVILGQRRGGHKVWRQVYEVQDPQVRRVRWKGHSEFMFWGCFSYDKKGPFHIWKAETTAQKKAAEAELKAKNQANEAEH